MIVKNIYIRRGLPFIKIHKDGNQLIALIDTGAQHSVVEDEDLLDGLRNGGQSVGQSGVAIDVQEGTFFFEMTDDLEIGSKTHKLRQDVKNFTLEPMSSAVHFNVDVLLGSDFLEKHNAVINFNESILILNTE